MNDNAAPEASIAFYEYIDNTTKETIFVSESELNTYPDHYTRFKFKYEKTVPIVVDKANGSQSQSTNPVNPLGLTPEQLQRRMDVMYKQGYREIYIDRMTNDMYGAPKRGPMSRPKP